MTKSSTAAIETQMQQTIGMDLGDKEATCAILDSDGVIEVRTLSLTRPGLAKMFASRRPGRIAIEAGMHSPWVSRALAQWGHEVIVANPRQVRLISHNPRKNDVEDAKLLARLARADPELLHPLCHRGEQAQVDMATIRTRDALVRSRTTLINTARGLVKSMGGRLGKSDSSNFADKVAKDVPPALLPAIAPLLRSIRQLTEEIGALDEQLEQMAEERYPETKLLRQIKGVGPVVSLTFVLTLEDPLRFPRSRVVGSYLGLVPRQHESGSQKPQLSITKAGNTYLRSVLIQSAQYVMRSKSPDTDLKRWGLKLAGAGSKAQKKRAIAAVARKLAVLLHHLWLSGQTYEPLKQAEAAAKDAP